MALRVEHEVHRRRLGRNIGLGLVLVGLVAIVFGLTVVKVLNLGDVRAVEGFDHVAPVASTAAPPAVAPAPAVGTATGGGG
jgi:hypothetical protein